MKINTEKCETTNFSNKNSEPNINIKINSIELQGRPIDKYLGMRFVRKL